MIGLSANIFLQQCEEGNFDSDGFRNYIQTPLVQILVYYNSPQKEFIDNFSQNLESIRDSLSSNDENEECIVSEKQTSNTKLGQIFTNFINEMKIQVNSWKNFTQGNIVAMEILKEVVSFNDGQNDGDDEMVDNQSENATYVYKLLTNQFEDSSNKMSLFESILLRLDSIQMKFGIKVENLTEIGDTIVNLQSSTCELLISLLISYPELF